MLKSFAAAFVSHPSPRSFLTPLLQMLRKLIAASLFAFFALNVCTVQAEEKVDFARQILPILSNKCFVCHGPDTKEEGLVRLDSFEGATADLGGYAAIDAKTPSESHILLRIHDADDPMPPKDAEKQLTAAEKKLIEVWLRQGGAYAKHWAFVPPVKVDPPVVQTATVNEIDAFIAAGMQAKNVDFAPVAKRTNLARRAALVLTGLPPEPEQLKAFLADESDQAYEKLVDELLASPRFGEHQARYWLDAFRYGDTHGLHLDNRRGIYPWRDWVIHALNRNLPIDDFLTWQLAGDLLPNPTLEQLAATGFVRMNPTTAEGGALPQEFQAKNNFDRTETLGAALLGMTLTCARCHTHKYDPITQTEYYQLFAFFNSTAENAMDGNAYTYGPTLKVPSDVEQWRTWTKLQRQREKIIAQLEASDTFTKAANLKSATELEKWNALVNANGPFAELPEHAAAKKWEETAAALKASFTATTLIARELPKPRTTQVLQRGEYNLPIGDPLQPGILNVTGSFPDSAPRNRLGLAQWLTSREQPLVSRVLINQIWQRTFGHGLVRTPEDFGLQGEQPTHPELLDWLAVEFQDRDWNLKSMLRMMVVSRTFRQSSAWRKEVSDPQNLLFARGPSYRLDAEVLRDMGLWASGLLDPTMGGEGVRPYQPEGMWAALAHPASNTKKYVPDTGDKIYRRSMYIYWKRTSPHPMMTLFDAPSRESSCVRRSRTNTALQSLALLNETQRIEMGNRLALRLLTEADSDADRLNLLFQLLASRNPTDRERRACERLLATMQAHFGDAPEEAKTLLAVGNLPSDQPVDQAAWAAWTQVAVTVLASDQSILLY